MQNHSILGGAGRRVTFQRAAAAAINMRRAAAPLAEGVPGTPDEADILSPVNVGRMA